MLFQVEVTTHCTFTCFYCAGRDMPQRHMAWPVFERVLERIPAGRHVVSLQGEGEPTLHPRFWDMVGSVRARGFEPTTITNGYELDVERMAAEFPGVGVSVDTLDEAEATRIGRLKLARVLANLERLRGAMGAERIRIMTVDYGQDLAPLRRFVSERGYGTHIVQSLMRKDDYARRYPRHPQPAGRGGAYHYQCRFLRQPLMRFYDIGGLEMPCCFIKDASVFHSIDALASELARRIVPAACAGCREIVGQAP